MISEVTISKIKSMRGWAFYAEALVILDGEKITAYSYFGPDITVEEVYRKLRLAAHELQAASRDKRPIT